SKRGRGAGAIAEPIGRPQNSNLRRDQSAQRARQPLVGESNRFGPGEPAHLLALARSRARVSVGGHEQIAQVEVHVTGGGGMYADMYQRGPRKRMPQRQTLLL